jgi:hypothetical protein
MTDVVTHQLNEADALLLAAKANTREAQTIRAEMIAVFMEWRRGRLAPRSVAPMSLLLLADLRG